MGLTMRRALKPLWFLLAVVFLVEAWLWDHLRAAIAWVIDLVPLDKFKTQLAVLVEKLPPWAVLIVFVVPFIVLLPLKFLEVYFLVRHQWVAAIFILALAKLLGLGVTAFIFDVTKPKLLQMAWFRWLYELALTLLAKAHALIDPIKLAIKRRVRRIMWLIKPGRSGRFFRHLVRVRRRASIAA